MGIFIYMYISILEIFTNITGRVSTLDSSCIATKNVDKLLRKYSSHVYNAIYFSKKINFFKKKNGFYFFLTAKSNAKVFFIDLCFFIFFIKKTIFLRFILNIFLKKISVEALIFFFLQINELDLFFNKRVIITSYINLFKISDFFLFSKLLLSKKISKVIPRLATTLCASQLNLNKKVQKNIKLHFLKKYNNIYKKNFTEISNLEINSRYLFLINTLFTEKKKFFFLRNNRIYNKSRYSRNRQTYRTGVFWCIWLTVLTVIGLYFYFYVFLIKFTYIWIFFYLFILSFFFYYFRSKVERHFFF